MCDLNHFSKIYSHIKLTSYPCNSKSGNFDVPDSLFSPIVMESLLKIPKDIHAVMMQLNYGCIE